jgi:hypothetical protein
MIEKPTQSRYLFPDAFFTAPLKTWARVVLQKISFVAQHCFLEQVVHYKALSDMEHEFLVVCASHPSGVPIYLSIDRIAGGGTTTKQVRCTSRVSSSPSSTSAPCGQPIKIACPSLANDRVQISHNCTPAPILAQHGDSVILSMVDFTSRTNASGSEKRLRPSLLHLSILLPIICEHFPRYRLLSSQCYLFARATYLVLIDHFDGMEIKCPDARRAGTWRGLHTSLLSAIPGAIFSLALGGVALANLTLLSAHPALLAAGSGIMAYNGWKLYHAITLQIAPNRREIRCAYPICRATSR